MKKHIRKRVRCATWLVVALATAVVAGCITVGKKFSRPGVEEFTLGRTTYSDVTSRLGKPYKEETGSKNGKPMRTLIYSYATEQEPAVYPDVIADREQLYTFCNDVLVAEAFTSTMREDHTDFDDKKIDLIKQGKTTIADVSSILGRPGGRAIYPVADNEDEMALLYLYQQVKRAGGSFQLETFEKSLEITYGRDDIVRKVEFSQSGKR